MWPCQYWLGIPAQFNIQPCMTIMWRFQCGCVHTPYLLCYVGLFLHYVNIINLWIATSLTVFSFLLSLGWYIQHRAYNSKSSFLPGWYRSAQAGVWGGIWVCVACVYVGSDLGCQSRHGFSSQKLGRHPSWIPRNPVQENWLLFSGWRREPCNFCLSGSPPPGLTLRPECRWVCRNEPGQLWSNRWKCWKEQ